MNTDALPSFDLTVEGYCHAVTVYALTGNPYILPWIDIMNDMLASGELVWEPAQTTEDRHSRLQAIRNMVVAIGLLSKQRLVNVGN